MSGAWPTLSSPSKQRDKATDKKIDMIPYARQDTPRQFADTSSATKMRKSGHRTFLPLESQNNLKRCLAECTKRSQSQSLTFFIAGSPLRAFVTEIAILVGIHRAEPCPSFPCFFCFSLLFFYKIARNFFISVGPSMIFPQKTRKACKKNKESLLLGSFSGLAAPKKYKETKTRKKTEKQGTKKQGKLLFHAIQLSIW